MYPLHRRRRCMTPMAYGPACASTLCLELSLCVSIDYNIYEVDSGQKAERSIHPSQNPAQRNPIVSPQISPSVSATGHFPPMNVNYKALESCTDAFYAVQDTCEDAGGSTSTHIGGSVVETDRVTGYAFGFRRAFQNAHKPNYA